MKYLCRVCNGNIRVQVPCDQKKCIQNIQKIVKTTGTVVFAFKQNLSSTLGHNICTKGYTVPDNCILDKHLIFFKISVAVFQNEAGDH